MKQLNRPDNAAGENDDVYYFWGNARYLSITLTGKESGTMFNY
jgi:hypothetical protein